jgi:hypothetical protein
VHIQHFMPARIDQCLHDEPGEATPTEFFKGEDPVDFVPVRMKSAPGDGGKRPVDKGAEYAVFGGIRLLLVIVVPDFFDEGVFGYGEFTGFRTSDIPLIGGITRSIKKLLKFLNRYIRLFQNCHKCPFLQLLMKRNCKYPPFFLHNNMT